MEDLEGAEGQGPIQWEEEVALGVDEVDILHLFMFNISYCCWQFLHNMYLIIGMSSVSPRRL